jgi:predicted Zn-dependent protease
MGTVMSRVRAVIGMRVISLALVASVAVGGCVTNPATGKKEFSLMSVQQEIELGAQADAQIVAEFGLYNDPAIASYVTGLGARVAAKAENPGYAFTFRVLDSPVINAFALPGGYVYVTRGLLAHLDNDAQLAVVLGHEVGHITARHSARAYTSAQLANIGVGLGSVLFEEVRPFLGAVQTGLQLLFLKFSRANETESDDLGVKYATRAGFDAKEGAEFFRSLERIQTEAEMKNGGKLPSWASTHPDPGDREVTVTQLAATYAAQLAPTGGLGGVNPAEYNARLENLVYGPDPRQGFVESGYFNHPQLRFRFAVPQGWGLANFATLVQFAPEAGDAAAEMSTVSGGTPSQVASSFVSQTGATIVTPAQSLSVNGHSAVRMITSLQMDNGQGGVIPLTIMSYFIQKDNLVYVFHGYSASANFARYQSAFETSFGSFATLTDAGALAVQPYRLDVFNAPRAAPFNQLVTAPAAKRGVGVTVDVNELAIMNQRQTTETVPAGTPLKKVE